MDADAVRPSPRLAQLFTAPVIALEASPGGTAGSADALHPQEAQHVARAAPKRIAEFAAGRACARAALAQLGVSDFPLRVGADREPLWPPGITGSITHAHGFCAAVVARSSALRSLGIDAERAGAVRHPLWQHIAGPAEREWLEGLAHEDALAMGTLVFSAKEAFFKCQHPLTREWVHFGDVRVRVEPPLFEIEPLRSLRLEGLQPPPWRGRFASAPGLLLTGIGIGPGVFEL